MHKLILDECDQMLESAPVEHIKIGKRLLDKSRECLRRCLCFPMPTARPANKNTSPGLKKELLAVAAFEDWNPTHFLDVAEMTMAVAIGYDWLFEKLSDQTAQPPAEAILTKGIQPSMDQKIQLVFVGRAQLEPGL